MWFVQKWFVKITGWVKHSSNGIQQHKRERLRNLKAKSIKENCVLIIILWNFLKNYPIIITRGVGENFLSPLIFFHGGWFNSFQFFPLLPFLACDLIGMLMSRANFSNEIGCETRGARLDYCSFTSLIRSIRWPNSQAHRPFLRAGNSPVPGTDPGIREGAVENERRSTYANHLFLSHRRKAPRSTWPWLCRKQRLAFWNIAISFVYPPNLSNTVVRPCIRLTRVQEAHPTTGPRMWAVCSTKFPIASGS